MKLLLLILAVFFLFFGIVGLLIIAAMDIAPFCAIGLFLVLGIIFMAEALKLDQAKKVKEKSDTN